MDKDKFISTEISIATPERATLSKSFQEMQKINFSLIHGFVLCSGSPSAACLLSALQVSERCSEAVILKVKASGRGSSSGSNCF